MGHLIFILLHFIAVILGFWMLIITIPTHLIYGVASSGKKELKEQVEELKEQTKILKGEEEETKPLHKYEKHFKIAFWSSLGLLVSYFVLMATLFA